MSQDPSRVEPYLQDGPPPSREPIRHQPEFHGRAGEFFGIWIVNIVLSVITLGIYSAWAKVRTQRYFYANTRLAGAPFEYLADPIAILKGRLIAYALLLTVVVSAKLQLFWVLIPLYLVLLVLFPWLIYLGLRFRARYSSWRGLRFRFDGSVGDAYANYMLLPIVSLFTLNLLWPWVHRNQQSYMVKGHRFGGSRFEFYGETGAYYRPFLVVLGLGIVGMIGLALAMGAFAAAAAGGTAGAPATPGAAVMTTLYAMIAVFYIGAFGLGIYLHARYVNLLWNNTRLGPHRFESTLGARQMIWLYLTNGLAILFSLGLALPWAKVRLMRYRVSRLVLVAEGSLEDFFGQPGELPAATGAEFADALDLDLEIAL